MRISGFVSELNPLHYGHKYLINKMIENKSDFIVTAMSPNFVMRGEPAIMNKFDRTKFALENGIDLVLQIPTIYSIEAADIYAKKGIEILIKAGCTDIYFGVEIDDVDLLIKIVKIKETKEYMELLKNYLKKGDSFNQASKKSIIDIDSSLEETLSSPNNLLAIEYIKAIREFSTEVNYHPIKRVDSKYYDTKINEGLIQSATALRENINLGNIEKYLPYSIHNIKTHKLSDYFDFINYRINSSSVDELKNILLISEGLENKIKSTKVNNLNDFIQELVSKRNRETKIKRILISIYLNILKEDLNLDYSKIYVLGFNKKASFLIKSDLFITNINSSTPKYIFKELEYDKLYDKDLVEEYKPIIYN